MDYVQCCLWWLELCKYVSRGKDQQVSQLNLKPSHDYVVCGRFFPRRLAKYLIQWIDIDRELNLEKPPGESSEHDHIVVVHDIVGYE